MSENGAPGEGGHAIRQCLCMFRKGRALSLWLHFGFHFGVILGVKFATILLFGRPGGQNRLTKERQTKMLKKELEKVMRLKIRARSGRPKDSQIIRQSDCPTVITVLCIRNAPLRASYLGHGGGYCFTNFLVEPSVVYVLSLPLSSSSPLSAPPPLLLMFLFPCWPYFSNCLTDLWNAMVFVCLCNTVFFAK